MLEVKPWPEPIWKLLTLRLHVVCIHGVREPPAPRTIARDVLHRRLRLKSASNSDLGYSWSNLARTLQLLGRYDEAEEAGRRGLANRMRATGRIIRRFNGLAYCYLEFSAIAAS